MLVRFLHALYAGEHLPKQERFYESVLKDIRFFLVAPQVYQLLRIADRASEVPAPFLDELRGRFSQSVCQSLYMKIKETQLLDEFERRGVPVIPLKGTRFAERVFGHVGARLTSDIDLFVPAERLEEAIACAESKGYAFEIVKDHHARLHKDGLTVELHVTLDKQSWSDLDPGPFWQHSERCGDYVSVRQLSWQHTFYFMCLHGARHHMDSIRYVLDVAQLLYAFGDRIDLAALFEQAAKDKTLKRVQAVLSTVYRQFPHLHAVKPLPFSFFVESHWTYETIKAARAGVKTRRYYVYKWFYRYRMFDTWRHALKSIWKPY